MFSGAQSCGISRVGFKGIGACQERAYVYMRAGQSLLSLRHAPSFAMLGHECPECVWTSKLKGDRWPVSGNFVCTERSSVHGDAVVSSYRVAYATMLF